MITDDDIRSGGSFLVSDLRASAHGNCVQCGRPATIYTLCDEHFNSADAGAVRLRAEFESLISLGMSEREADRWLCHLLDQGWEP